MKAKEAHVVPSHAGEGWEVVQPGAPSRDSEHPTQKAAQERARELVRESGGGEVVVHGRDGLIKDSDTLEGSNRASRRRQ